MSNQNNQRRVTIWDTLATLWGALAEIIIVINGTIKTAGVVIDKGAEMTETVLDTGIDLANLGLETTNGMRKNQLLKIEDELKATIGADPKMEERLKGVEKVLEDKRNASKSRRNRFK